MIRVPLPPDLYPPELRELMDRATAECLEEFRRSGRGTKPKWKPEIWRRAREPLFHLFNNNCAYCETRVSGPDQPGDLEHYRPKKPYFWLAYTPDNLLLLCARCATSKKDGFPIDGKVATVGATGAELDAENPLLLNPFRDDPDNHLVFEVKTGQCLAKTERGRATIQLMNLNREDLLYRRKAAGYDIWSRMMRSIVGEDPKRFQEDYDQVLSGDKEFSGFLRQSIAERLRALGPSEAYEALARQRKYSVETSDADQDEEFRKGNKRIERIEIKDMKAIESLDLVFPSPEQGRASWLMFLGENGVGKSSVLQGVALALMGEEHANSLGLDASRFVRTGSSEGKGYVRVHLSEVGPVEVRFQEGSARFEVDPKTPKVLVLGYGATRLLPHAAGREAPERKAVRIQNLFDPIAPLSATEEWLLDPKRLGSRRFKRFTRGLIPLLMLPSDTTFHQDKGFIEVEWNGTRTRLSGMSDGYQSIVALLGDIALGVSGKFDSLETALGVVLLDEIEVHLHPRWKISIVERLRDACPKLTFLATTHDPLCLKGLSPREIVLFTKGPDERVHAETDIPPLEHFRSDQILTSFLFNLDSTRDRATAPMVARYSMLLGKERRTAAEEDEFRALERKIEEQFSDSVTPGQRRVEEAVRRVFDAMGGGPELDENAVNAEIRRQVGDILRGEGR